MTDEKFLLEVNDRLKKAREHLSEWRQEAKEDYDFVAGEQWAEEDKLTLREQLRPLITFNRISPVIDSIVGHQVQNRHETKFVPREIGDVGVNEVLTSAAKWIRDGSGSEDEETDAFMDSVICGYGWMETRMDYDDDPEGMIVESRVDPFEMYYDPAARKRNLSDMRYLFRVKEVSRYEFEDMFPDFNLDELGSGDDIIDNLEDGEVDTVDPGDNYRFPDTATPKDGKYKVIEYQWCEKKPYYKVADQNELTEMDDEKYGIYEERMQLLNAEPKSVKMYKKVYKRAYICRGTVIEQGDAPYEEGFNYKAITGKRHRNKGVFYGIVRAMKDPQRWANKWLSQTLHIINTNSKGGLFAEADAFVNQRQAEEDYSSPDAITILRPGGLNKIREKPPVNFPSGMDHLMQFAVGSIRDVSGVNLEMLGATNRQQSGLLEQTRQAAGITILATVFDSLRRYYKENGKMLLWFIREYLSDGRLVRIVGQDGGQQFVPLVKQEDTVKFDVVVDESPTSRNQKQAVWELIIQMMPILSTQNVPASVWAELLKYSPLPQSVSQKIGQEISQPQGPSPEEQKLKADMQRQQAQQQVKEQELQIKQFSAETERLAAVGKIESDKMANDIDKLEAWVKASGLDVDMENIRISAMKGVDELSLRADENRVRERVGMKPAAGTG